MYSTLYILVDFFCIHKWWILVKITHWDREEIYKEFFSKHWHIPKIPFLWECVFKTLSCFFLSFRSVPDSHIQILATPLTGRRRFFVFGQILVVLFTYYNFYVYFTSEHWFFLLHALLWIRIRFRIGSRFSGVPGSVRIPEGKTDPQEFKFNLIN